MGVATNAPRCWAGPEPEACGRGPRLQTSVARCVICAMALVAARVCTAESRVQCWDVSQVDTTDPRIGSHGARMYRGGPARKTALTAASISSQERLNLTWNITWMTALGVGFVPTIQLLADPVCLAQRATVGSTDTPRKRFCGSMPPARLSPSTRERLPDPSGSW
jgi:hypothetical protein